MDKILPPARERNKVECFAILHRQKFCTVLFDGDNERQVIALEICGSSTRPILKIKKITKEIHLLRVLKNTCNRTVFTHGYPDKFLIRLVDDVNHVLVEL